MTIEIFGKNYNPSDSLKAITEKKCEKLKRHLGDDESAEVKFVVTLTGDEYTTDLTVITRGATYRANATSSTPFDNLDTVIPRLLGQMRKQKDIWGKDKKGADSIDNAFVEEEEI